MCLLLELQKDPQTVWHICTLYSEGSKTLMKLQCLVSLTYTCSNTQTGVGVWQCMCNTLNTKRRDQGHYYHHSDLFKQPWHRATVCFAKGGERNLRHETQMHIKSWETLTMQVIKKLPSCVNWSSHLNFALCLAFSVLTLSSVSSSAFYPAGGVTNTLLLCLQFFLIA